MGLSTAIRGKSCKASRLQTRRQVIINVMEGRNALRVDPAMHVTLQTGRVGAYTVLRNTSRQGPV